MSEKMPSGLAFAEKLLGMIIALLGVILTYYTYNSPNVAGTATGFFIAGGLLLIILGLILVIARTE